MWDLCGQSGTGAGFRPSPSAFTCQHLSIAVHIHSRITWGMDSWHVSGRISIETLSRTIASVEENTRRPRDRKICVPLVFSSLGAAYRESYKVSNFHFFSRCFVLFNSSLVLFIVEPPASFSEKRGIEEGCFSKKCAVNFTYKNRILCRVAFTFCKTEASNNNPFSV